MLLHACSATVRLLHSWAVHNDDYKRSLVPITDRYTALYSNVYATYTTRERERGFIMTTAEEVWSQSLIFIQLYTVMYTLHTPHADENVD